MPTRLRLSDDPAQTAAELDRALPREGGLILFEGAPEPALVAACDALAHRRDLRLNRIDAAELADDDVLAARGNVREVFDEIRNPAVLVLTNAEVLFDAPTPAGDDPDARPPSEQLGLYLFDRIEAFEGVVALALRRLPAHLEEHRTRAVVVTP